MSNPTTPKTPTPPTLPAGVTKLCHIVKRADFDGYGFNLHSEKVKPGQFIGKVDVKSPAEAAGLKEGDRILEVNGVSIGSETHKQVVARVKAIANEVRLLLIDVDGKGDEVMAATKATITSTTNGTNAESNELTQSGTRQELPGASANISSISLTSTKRSSNASSNQSSSTLSADVVDKALPVSPTQQQQQQQQQNGHTMAEKKDTAALIAQDKPLAINNNNNNNNTLITTPPPPSAAVAVANNNSNNNNNNMIYSTNGSSNGNATPSSLSSVTTTQTTGVNRAGSLNLPLTVAEMRAKLASKKKYDPKNESVDLKKKFDIIQKL